MKVAVVGAGWAGLAAAVRATQAGHAVTLYETTRRPGGRARRLDVDGLALDNGQHILIGAYARCLALMQTVGADPVHLLHRLPLTLRYPDGRGLALRPGLPALSFLRAVAGAQGFSLNDKRALLTAAAGWLLAGFRCPEQQTVAELCGRLPRPVRELLIDPLCVAALNTPAQQASAAVFLRVLKDALFGGRGASDLLLPRRSLGCLLPEPALSWLQEAGATLRAGQRVQGLQAGGGGWLVDGEPFGAVVLACGAQEAARLAAVTAPQWAATARGLHWAPIVTVYLHHAAARLPAPMTALLEGPDAPAQFAFDHGALGGSAGVFAFVVSSAGPWLDDGLEALVRLVVQQAATTLLPPLAADELHVLRAVAERRATFACTPHVQRPSIDIAHSLYAAGDYVAGPYPATLEGAVRSAEDAVAALVAAGQS